MSNAFVARGGSLPACHCVPSLDSLLWRARPWIQPQACQRRKDALCTSVAQRSLQERGPVLDSLTPVDAEDNDVSIESTRSSSESAMHGMDGADLGVELAKVAFDVKGGDIRLLNVADLVYWTSYLLMVSVFSRPQLQAILVRMQRRGQELGRSPSLGASGKSAWEVLDYGDVVVHVMTPEQRDFYDLESFYGAAEEVDLPFLKEEQRFGGDWMKTQTL